MQGGKIERRGMGCEKRDGESKRKEGIVGDWHVSHEVKMGLGGTGVGEE